MDGTVTFVLLKGCMRLRLAMFPIELNVEATEDAIALSYDVLCSLLNAGAATCAAKLLMQHHVSKMSELNVYAHTHPDIYCIFHIILYSFICVCI